MVLEESKEENIIIQKEINYNITQIYIDEFIKYLEEQDNATHSNKMLLKKLQLLIKKICFDTKEQKK